MTFGSPGSDLAQSERECNAITFGQWETERDSVAAFDAAVDPALWTVHREVCGVMLHPRPEQAERTLRIDRVLVPKARLVDLGWRHGFVGVEIKKSGVSIGPPIAQAIDYRHGVWTIGRTDEDRPRQFQVWLGWIFIWPMSKQSGPVASVLAQQRLGSASTSRYERLYFKSGEAAIFRQGRDGDVRIGKGVNGARTGSR